jgi:hypothetical protein
LDDPAYLAHKRCCEVSGGETGRIEAGGFSRRAQLAQDFAGCMRYPTQVE